jgi:hypothetical protein
MKQLLIRNWILLALASLIIPGITAIVLVTLRTINVEYDQWQQLFRTALVIHVDLSVYIWMVTGILLMLSLTENIADKIQKNAYYLAMVGAILISIAAFIDKPTPLLNNYIPVLESVWFFIGLGVFSLAALIVSIAALKPNTSLSAKIMSLLYIISVLITLDSFLNLEPGQDNYYEYLFWGGGHILQLAVCMLMLNIWVKLHNLNGSEINSKLQNSIYFVMFAPVFYALYVHSVFEVDSSDYRSGMTNMMIWGNGIAPIMLAIIVLTNTKLASLKSVPNISMYSSIFMFMAGGLIAMYISGINTIIPAHYHGSIVGVTLAIMALIYYSLTELGYSLSMPRLAFAQPLIYTLGQLMHISGLAISGSNGAARKTMGEAGNLAQSTDISLFLTRIGGLVAVLGGIIFIVVVYKSIKVVQKDSGISVE